MNECLYCHRQDRQVKNGKNASGSQGWRCQHCQRKYTPVPSEHGYPEALRQQAVKLSVDGWHQLPPHRPLSWCGSQDGGQRVQAYSDQLLPAPVPAELNNAELDELFTYVGKKKTSST